MFTITLGDKTKEYARLNDATNFANKVASEQGVEVEVVHQETEAVAYVTNPQAIRKAETGEYFTPRTRVEVPKHHAPNFPGFVTAYTRRRIGATVYRGQEKHTWRVFDGRTGKFRDVANTTESRLLLTEMKLGLHL